jgi:tripartite-type tricarboxylate transporter receptor subunit TctC
MMLSRRALAPVLALACALSWPLVSLAQDYPAHPVKIVVPFGAGGPADVFSRVLAQHLSDALKQPFVIEDHPGAGSIIGTDAVAKSVPDGYTLLAMSNTHTTNESLIPNKPFQLMRDFVPVAGINYSDLVMVIHPSVPAKDLSEFIASIAEAGVPGYESTIWLGIMAPAGTAKAIVDKLNAGINQAIDRPDVKEAWDKQGAVPLKMSPAEFDKYLRADVEKWAQVVKVSGAQAQ